MHEKLNYHSKKAVYLFDLLPFLKAWNTFKRTIYRILIMKNVFRWHVTILINKLFFFFGKTWFKFSFTQTSWYYLNPYDALLHDCYYLHHLPVQLYFQNNLIWRRRFRIFIIPSSFFFFFSFKTWLLRNIFCYLVRPFVALKLKSLKSVFVKIELSMDSCSHHHPLGLKNFKSTKFIF